MSGGPLTDQVDLQPLRAGRADLLHIEGDFIAGGKNVTAGHQRGRQRSGERGSLAVVERQLHVKDAGAVPLHVHCERGAAGLGLDRLA
ncbi:hypothetical protein SNK04_014271 [Fusarium graminearum]